MNGAAKAAALIAQALAEGIPLFISDVTFRFNRAKRSSGERRTEIWSSYPAEPLLIVDSCIYRRSWKGLIVRPELHCQTCHERITSYAGTCFSSEVRPRAW